MSPSLHLPANPFFEFIGQLQEPIFFADTHSAELFMVVRSMVNGTITKMDLSNPQVKNLSACEAALILSKKQKELALRVLIDLSRDNDPVVRIRAAECLMEIGNERAVMGLIELLDDPHPKVRITAIGALGCLRAHIAKDRLQKILEFDPEISVRIIAARNLGRLGNKDGLVLILRLFDSENEYFRRLAVMALRDIIGQVFSPTEDGIKSAKRYLDMNLNKYFSGDLK